MKAGTSIHPRLISMVGRKLYSKHPIVIVPRELIQNSIDACKKAGTSSITLTLDTYSDGKRAIVTCQDNGCGMTEEELVTKFLCLGASGKENDQDATGGFGIAKAAIMSNVDWEVTTLDHACSFADVLHGNDIRVLDTPIDGTIVRVVIEEKYYNWTISEAIQMIYFSNIDIHLIYMRDDEVIIDDPHAGLSSIKSETASNILSSNEDWTATGYLPLGIPGLGNISNRNIYRLNGLVQYITVSSSRDTNIFFDIFPKVRPDSKDYPFSLSRESIISYFSDPIFKLISSYDVNNQSAISDIASPVQSTRISKGYFVRGGRSSLEDEYNAYSIFSNISNDFDLENSGNFIEGASCPALCIEDYDERNKSTLRLHSKVLMVWEEILKLVASDKECFGLGITGKPSTKAYRSHKNGETFYGINPYLAISCSLTVEGRVLYMWYEACHEVSHSRFDTHDECQSMRQSLLFQDTIDIITQNMSRLKAVWNNR